MEDLFFGKRTGKVISFEDYCRSQNEKREASEGWTQEPQQRKFRARLELLCLLLEAGVGLSLLLVILGSIQPPFSR